MDNKSFGDTVKQLRLNKKMTQKDIAQKLIITEEAVFKWERGISLPDIMTCSLLTNILEVNIEVLFGDNFKLNIGEIKNMKNLFYYICQICGNVIVSNGKVSIQCCKHDLLPTEPVEANYDEKMKIEIVEDEWYISTSRPMTKDDYISFSAFAIGEKIEITNHYPEWNFEIRFPKYYHGKFMWYSKKRGLKCQII